MAASAARPGAASAPLVTNIIGYYSIATISYGLQAGLQEFDYALCCMTDAALQYLDSSEGCEVGVGPSIVVVEVSAPQSLPHDPGRACIVYAPVAACF